MSLIANAGCRPLRLCLTIFLIVPACGQLTATAGEWQTDAGLSITEAYSDNVKLEGANEDSEFISSLAPSFRLSGQGRRARLDLAASLQLNDYRENSDNFRPTFDGAGNIELLEDHFFVEADASAGQTTINPFAVSGLQGRGGLGFSSIAGDANQATTYTVGFSPYFVSRIKRMANVEVRYSYDEQFISGSALDDSTGESAIFRLKSGDDFSTLSWGWNVDHRQTEFEQVSGEQNFNNEFNSSILNLGYQLTRKWQITSSFGREWNDFIASDPDIDGEIWTAGVVWTPNERVSLSTKYGRRFFGDTPSLAFSYRHKRSSFTANYSEQLTDTRSLRGKRQVLLTENGYALVLDPNTGQIIIIPENQTISGNSALINRQADLSYAFHTNRTTIRFNGRQSRQTRLEDDLESIFSSYGFYVSRDISPLLNLDLSLSWSSQEDPDENLSKIKVAYLGINREIIESVILSAGYSHAVRDTERLNDRNYRENRANVSLRLNF